MARQESTRGCRRLCRLRYAAFIRRCRCSQRCTRVSAQTATLNRSHSERSRWGRKTVSGASIIPSRCASSASASESSIWGNRAHRNMPSRGSVNNSSPIRSKVRTTLGAPHLVARASMKDIFRDGRRLASDRSAASVNGDVMTLVGSLM